MRVVRLLSIVIAAAHIGCGDNSPPPRPDPPELKRKLLDELFIIELRNTELTANLHHPAVRGSTNPEALELIRRTIAFSQEMLARYDPEAGTDIEILYAGEVGRTLAGLAYELISTDIDATAHGQAAQVRSQCNLGLQGVFRGMRALLDDPRWFLVERADASDILHKAARARDSARLVAPVAYVAQAGATAAMVVDGTASLIRIAQTGGPALARLSKWLLGGARPPAVLALAGEAGAGAGMAVLSTSGTLVLTEAEIMALVEAGKISSTALALYKMARVDTHHIATDKNGTSDREGGPWTPRFRELFKNADMSFDDPANLVDVANHRGPHPEAYHKAVLKALTDAVEDLKAHTTEYREALKRALGKLAEKIRTPGTPLNQMVTRTGEYAQ